MPDDRCIATPKLVESWRQIDPMSCKSWRTCTGPLQAAALSLKRIGWSWSSAFCMGNDLGQEICITDLSPCLLGSMLRAACIRRLERLAMAKYQDTIPLDEGLDHHEYQGRRLCADAVTAYLASGKNSAVDKVHARCLATGAYWTMDRYCRGGYLASPLSHMWAGP